VNCNYSTRVLSATSSSLAETFSSDPSILRSRDDTDSCGLNVEGDWEGEGDIEMQGEQVMLLPIVLCYSLVADIFCLQVRSAVKTWMSHPMMTSSSSSNDAMQPSAFIRSLVLQLCEEAASTSFRPSGLHEDAEAAGRHSVPLNAAPRSSPPSSLLNAAWQRIARHNSINSMSCITVPKTSNTNTSSFLFYKRPIVSSPAASSAQLCDTFVVFEREGVVDADGGSDGGGPVGDCNQVAATPLDSNAGDNTTAPVAESNNSISDSRLTYGDIMFRLAFRGERRVFALNARDLMRSNRFVTHKTKIISIITCST
jgi:hypothetical protein